MNIVTIIISKMNELSPTQKEKDKCMNEINKMLKNEKYTQE